MIKAVKLRATLKGYQIREPIDARAIQRFITPIIKLLALKKPSETITIRAEVFASAGEASDLAPNGVTLFPLALFGQPLEFLFQAGNFFLRLALKSTLQRALPRGLEFLSLRTELMASATPRSSDARRAFSRLTTASEDRRSATSAAKSAPPSRGRSKSSESAL
jgi:hypothetical protein